VKTEHIKKHTISDIIEILGENPQYDGLHIHISKNKFKEIPISYPFKSDNFTLLCVGSGEINFQLNLLKYSVKKNEAIVIVPNSVVQVLQISSDLEIIAISFTLDFLLKNAFNKTDLDALNFLMTKNISKLLFNNDELTVIKNITLLIKTKLNDNFLYKNESILHAFNLLMYELATIYSNQINSSKKSISRQEELTLRFFRILEDNFKSERTVQFYAEILCVTPGHLSKVLKAVSGKTTSQLIDDVVIMEACILLNNPSLTIAQVANELQFSDQSFFGKFFKKQIGISPSKYRNLKS
jgi:AraC-like DNA-binding protein